MRKLTLHYTDVILCTDRNYFLASVYFIFILVSKQVQSIISLFVFGQEADCTKLYEIYFSPTGGTQKAVELLAKELSGKIQRVDLTDSEKDFSEIFLSPADIAIIGAPSFTGRVPQPAVQRLLQIHGNAARAVILCTYGNRAYEDTLIELQDIAMKSGFRVISAIAAIAEHSIAHQIGAGRPDAKDYAQLAGFAQKIRAKLSAGDVSAPSVPGNRPYQDANEAGLVPWPTDDCTNCGLCATKCPVQAIDRKDASIVDDAACISCMRCIAICPHKAREANSEIIAAVNAMLAKACPDRKEYELYI